MLIFFHSNYQLYWISSKGACGCTVYWVYRPLFLVCVIFSLLLPHFLSINVCYVSLAVCSIKHLCVASSVEYALFTHDFCLMSVCVAWCNVLFYAIMYCIVVYWRQCFDAVGWTAWGHSACEKLSGVLLAWCLSRAWCRLSYGPADTTATDCLLLQ